MKFSRRQQFAILFAVIVVLWAAYSLLIDSNISMTDIASSFLLCVVAITYLFLSFKPHWSNTLLAMEGVVFVLVGLIFMSGLLQILFIVLGIILVVFTGITQYLLNKRMP
ncbi:MAG: hypothetical protein LBR24_00940 [Methanobrevibacter sp.]|jgi:hypothetical protein|nr:hypothetical protein [Methanobrevibacter sp.]